MTENEFWNLVERVHVASPSDMGAKCGLLEKELLVLPLEDVLSFDRHLSRFYHQANSWDLWGAAYVICDSCGDDSFMDFRCTLISMGRGPFQAALADADSLADFDIDPGWARFEGYRYVVGKVCSNLGYESPEATELPKVSQQTIGVEFDPEEMTPRFPRLVAKYNYTDTPPEVLKEKRDRAKKKEEMSEMVKRALLFGMVPSCGLVPPPRIAKQVLATGTAPVCLGLTYRWDPFVLNEEHFWIALKQLEEASPDDLKGRPDLHGKILTLDTGCGGIGSYDEWMQSLKVRGHLK